MQAKAGHSDICRTPMKDLSAEPPNSIRYICRLYIPDLGKSHYTGRSSSSMQRADAGAVKPRQFNWVLRPAVS